MIKDVIVIKFIQISLSVIALNGRTFIIKDGQAIKYFGIDGQRGDEFLNQVLDK
ncbi:MAG: hypothetical protein Q8N62_02895 [Candidatus Omnitrophota bacterium]|nr:hypothetical protein [Candidatus Omnitrophota bacterium]